MDWRPILVVLSIVVIFTIAGISVTYIVPHFKATTTIENKTIIVKPTIIQQSNSLTEFSMFCYSNSTATEIKADFYNGKITLLNMPKTYDFCSFVGKTNQGYISASNCMKSETYQECINRMV